MWKYRFRYLLITVGKNLIMFFLLLSLGFLLPRLIPGSPLAFVGEEIHALNLKLPEETYNRFTEYYAPHQNLWVQYQTYFAHLLRGDWGYSFYFGLPVKEIIWGKIGLTLFLSFSAILLGTIVALPVGTYLGWRKGAEFNFSFLTLLLVQTIPSFLLAIIMQMIFSFHLRLFPPYGAYPPGMSFGDPGFWVAFSRHAVLPVSVLTISTFPAIAILTRNVVKKVGEEGYVEVAYYLGLTPNRIRWFYVLLNSLPEILGRLNIIFLYAISGSLFVEVVFAYPGMGSLMKIAVEARDYPLIQGIFLVISVYAILVNLIFEVLQGRLDPRLVS